MSLRHSVLGLLALAPSNGYELTRRFDDTLRNAWHASHSQIYPELAKLEAEGLVEVVGEGARGSRTYAATEAGRAEVRRWMVEESPEHQQRNVTAVRWFLAFLLSEEERRAYFAGELARLEAVDAYMRAERDEMDRQGKTGGFRPVLEMGLRMQEVMLEWLREQAGVSSAPSPDS
jgi:DNA-binding PadR family transcriptional regulator